MEQDLSEDQIEKGKRQKENFERQKRKQTILKKIFGEKN